VEDYQLINSLWQELYIVTSRNAWSTAFGNVH
jgi:hypothetical protein